MPPQFYLLTTLASVLSGDSTTIEQKDAIGRLSCGAFGGYVINPRSLPEKDEQGLMVLTYEGDETRGGKRGARHRVRVRSKKGAVGASSRMYVIDPDHFYTRSFMLFILNGILICSWIYLPNSKFPSFNVTQI